MKVDALPAGLALTWRTLDPAPIALARLVVLLPNTEVNEAMLARAIWVLSMPRGLRVHVVAMIDDWADEGEVRLRLALLTALLRESGIDPSVELEQDDADWMRIARRVCRPGDAVVCHAEQTAAVGLRGARVEHQPLGACLAALRLPVCELSGVITRAPALTLRQTARAWLLPFAFVIVTLFLELLFLGWARGWADWARRAVLAAWTTAEILTVARLIRS